MGTQGTGRKRSTKKERSTAEDDALNLIAREAEARLAAKRAARAEAREIRMKELERQQKEIFQVQKKYYGLDSRSDDRGDSKWGDIEQWMEDSERYSRSSRIHTLSDEDERMSVGSRGSVRSDLDAVGAYGGGDSSSLSLKKSKKKKKHKHRERNGCDDDYSVTSSRSSRLSDDSRVSRASRSDLQPTSYAPSDLYSFNGLSSSRSTGPGFSGYQSSLYEDGLSSGSRRAAGSSSHPLECSSYRSSGSRASSRASSARASPVDNCSSVASFLRSAASSCSLPRDLDEVTIPDFPDVEDRDYLEKGSRAASALTAGTLTSLGGTSSRRGSGETAITVDAETTLREIKEIHELKDQIQDVEIKYTQNLKEAKDALAEVEEKYRKAMVSNAQLDNEKNNLMYQVDTLKDALMELEEMLSESQRGYEDKVKELDREKHAHSVLQFQFSEMKETLKQSEELLNEIRQLRMKQDAFVREISDLQETVDWKDKKIGALERQKEYTDAIRIERDELREEVVTLKDILKKHGIVLGPDLTVNGDIGVAEDDGSPSADRASQSAVESQTPPTEGNSMLGSTEGTQLTSRGAEEMDPDQHQKMFEEVEENHLSADKLCHVDVSTLETPTEEQPCFATEEDNHEERDLSKDLNVDIDECLNTEAKDMISHTNSKESVPETPEIDSVETSSPDLGETEPISSVATHSEDVKENICEEQEDKPEELVESNLSNSESCPQKEVTQDVLKESLPDESVPMTLNAEPQPEPENIEEVENDEAEETCNSQPHCGAAGKKKKKKKRGKKKRGPHEEKNQRKDATDKEKGRAEKETESATRDDGGTTQPDESVNGTLKELRMDEVKKASEAFSQSETIQDRGIDHFACEHDKEHTFETKTIEEKAVTTSDTLSYIKTLKEIKTDDGLDEQKEKQSLGTETEKASETLSLIQTLEESIMDPKTNEQDEAQTENMEEVQAGTTIDTFPSPDTLQELKLDVVDEQNKEQSLVTETVEAVEVVSPTEDFCHIETLKECRVDPKDDEQDAKQGLETEKFGVESITSPVPEDIISPTDPIDCSKCSEDSAGPDELSTSSGQNPTDGTDLSTNGTAVHSESDIAESAEDDFGSIDEMKSDCTTTTNLRQSSEAESLLSSNDIIAADESDVTGSPERKDDASVSLSSTGDGMQSSSNSEVPSEPSAVLNSDASNTPIEVSARHPEEEEEEQRAMLEPESSPQNYCEDESQPEPDGAENEDLMDGKANCPSLSESTDSFDTEKRLDSVEQTEQLEDFGSQTLKCEGQAEESTPEASSETEEINYPNVLNPPHSPKDAAGTGCSMEQVDRTEESAAAEDQDVKLEDFGSQTLQCEGQAEESIPEASSETEEISYPNVLNPPDSPKDAAGTGCSMEQVDRTEESAAAEDPDVNNGQNDQPSETKCDQSHEPSKVKPGDDASSQPKLQDADEEDGEDEEGQSFDFDDMDMEVAIATNLAKNLQEDRVEEGVEVMSEESSHVSPGQNETESDENRADQSVGGKGAVAGGPQAEALDTEPDIPPGEDAVTGNVCGETTPEEEVVLVHEQVVEEDQVLAAGLFESTNQLPVEEGLDAIAHELQGQDAVLPKSKKETKKDAKKSVKKGKAKGKEECKMS